MIAECSSERFGGDATMISSTKRRIKGNGKAVGNTKGEWQVGTRFVSRLRRLRYLPFLPKRRFPFSYVYNSKCSNYTKRRSAQCVCVCVCVREGGRERERDGYDVTFVAQEFVVSSHFPFLKSCTSFCNSQMVPLCR